jgi:flagellar basal body-associated protein FliL
LGSYPYPQNSDPQIIYSNDDSIQYKLDYTTIISIISMVLAIIGLCIIIFMFYSKGKNNNYNINNSSQRENSLNETLFNPKHSYVKIITDSEKI